MQIQNSVALVTGANRGVGKQYVAQLVKRGASKIYVCARNIDDLSATVSIAPSLLEPLQLDVTNADQIVEAAAMAKDVTLLINNAGSLNFGGALEVSNSAIEQDMAVNNDGLRNVTRAFTPIIETNGGGAVVNMLTLLSLVSAPGFAGYNASKAAAWSMSMSLRAYLRPKNIQVINAFPAGIDTDMLVGVDAPKDSAVDVASDVLNALEANQEDVYPASAKEVFKSWRQDQKAVEAAFAQMM